MNEDEPYVPKISTKPKPDHLKRKEKADRERKPNRPSQGMRQRKYRRELRELNIHQPKRVVTKQHVDAIRSIKEQLRETWHAHWDKVERFKNLTPKQVEFARQYAINGRTNKCGAARLAGYDSGNYNILLRIANKNLAIPHFHDLVTAFEIEEKARMKISVQEVVEWFQRIAAAAMETGDYANANRAMENLAKYLQMFVERKEITHRTVHSREELDTRIKELTSVLQEADADITDRIRIN
jgi:hypothetical protein